MSKVRMKVTITGYYEADPAHYEPDGDLPEMMAKLDWAIFDGDYTAVLAAIEGGDETIAVEPA